ncbi:scavenger receptor protein [Tribolium castaneum]|uniref:Scavenger receptor class B member 1 n=1 Tax=Tribolium castaneum TaxID=7070 RepID=D2A3T6_TRICA|nr:scavenger receptor protein [Tribolium castaneum]EFA05669.1 Protein croquemort-like Protein [Tribolium castaneum]|eukprot:NP_001164133.1 scavenger receptor protein [Tribolium castaneum]
MSRRDESEKMPPHKPNIEKNCGQIFSKGPTITREIFEKMQKNKTYIMGYQIQTRQFWVLSGLSVLFLLSLTGVVAMWFTDMFDNAVFANLAIIPDTQSYDMWVKPSPKPLLKVHIFNYTNVPEFESRDDEKLNVKEVGPYVYEAALERVNSKFDGSHVSYQEQRVYKFMPELSIGRKQNDRVIVPNIPLFTAASLNKHSTFLTRVGISSLLNSLNAKPFLSLPAHRFIIGYEDNLYALSKSYMKFQNQKPYEHFGLVSSNAGIRDDVVTINTGASDINKIGLIESFNGEPALNFWSTAECNDISAATDGTLFSPRLVRNKRPIQFYLKEMCRPLPLHFKEEVKILNGKIPAYRYTLPENVFDTPERTPSNQCYCDLDLGECPLQGVFNATPCTFGAPIFMSFPHFHNADPALKEGVTGLNPDSVYETYADLHPTLGFVMAGKNRIQVNVQVAKAFGISQVNMFEDGLMLPVAWIEYVLEDKTLPDDMISIIFQTTFTLRSVELGLKYGCILSTGVTLFCILMILKNKWARRERTSSVRPLQANEEICMSA